MWKTFSEEELLDQYMPSRAVVRELLDDPITHFTKVAQAKSEHYRNSLPCLLGVPYTESQSDEARFDWFPSSTESPNRRQIFLFIHGGSWQRFSLGISSSFAGPVTEKGFTFVSLGYDLANPEKNIDIVFIVKQLRQGIKAIIGRAKRDNIDKIILTGHSAGAHLAAMLLANVKVDLNESDQNLLTQEEMNYIQRAILFDGLHDIAPLVHIRAINHNLQLTDSSATKLSPMNYVDQIARQNVRLLLITGEHSCREFQRQNREFNEAINSHSNKSTSEFHQEQLVDHFTLIEYLDDVDFPLWTVIHKFLDQ